MKNFIGSESRKSPAIAAEKEPGQPKGHNKFILFIIWWKGWWRLVTKPFLAEKLKFIVTQSVGVNVSF